MRSCGGDVTFDDRRGHGRPLPTSVSFERGLRQRQCRAFGALMAYDNGVLAAFLPIVTESAIYPAAFSVRGLLRIGWCQASRMGTTKNFATLPTLPRIDQALNFLDQIVTKLKRSAPVVENSSIRTVLAANDEYSCTKFFLEMHGQPPHEAGIVGPVGEMEAP